MIELSRDNDARHSAHARDLRHQISDYQRINLTGSSAGLVGDTTALYDRIRDLEDRIRSVHLVHLIGSVQLLSPLLN